MSEVKVFSYRKSEEICHQGILTKENPPPTNVLGGSKVIPDWKPVVQRMVIIGKSKYLGKSKQKHDFKIIIIPVAL